MTHLSPSRWRWLSHVASGRGHAFERLTAGEVRTSACGNVTDRDCPQLVVVLGFRVSCLRNVRAAEAKATPRPSPETRVS